jgi:Flp pilus assembly protein TadB
MNNLTRGQIILIGVAALFGIPICIGFAVGYVAGFWTGVVATVVAIAVIAFIAQRWWEKKVRQNKGKDDDK